MVELSSSALNVSPEIYDELRRVAVAYMRRDSPGQTLQATALVNEAWVRLAQSRPAWRDRQHFVAIAARSMRQVLVDRARARGAAKRWAALDRVTLHDSIQAGVASEDMLPALDEALTSSRRWIPSRRGSSSCGSLPVSASKTPRRHFTCRQRPSSDGGRSRVPGCIAS